MHCFISLHHWLLVFLCTRNNTGVYLTSAWKKLPAPLCTRSYGTAPAACGHTGLSCDVCVSTGKVEGQVTRDGPSEEVILNSCDHCFWCRGFLFCTGPSQCPCPTCPDPDPKRGAACLFLALLFLPAGKGTACAMARCGAGAAMSALDPRGQQNTAGEAPSARGGRGLVTKGTPTRGSSRAGGSGTAAWESQKMLRKRSGTLPA